ncbi:bile acid:sodium symporter family protein [Haloflavibacter putidus]|uniref:Bile acid:sodium symporter n=1 Tax=Haloflavibacter putidus TaxID=2576776 RepID=A0A507ZZ47_9FLAO|nr:bile acid:sodium symporter family protein [Haloflavibacter putidus]TQD38862.1 bile acid:sodium symporter [Haloflavibacter putidus]
MRNPFILALFLSIILAFFFPGLSQIIPLDSIITIGIALIFFFYGLKLSPSDLANGMKNYRLHILVQSCTFIFFPLLILSVYPIFINTTGFDYWLAFFFLAALPSTVSSSVVMVSIARGNVPAAIFNASISGLIGVIVTPLWLSMFLDASQGLNFLDVVLSLVYTILIPLGLGFLLHRFFRKFINLYGSYLGYFDKSVIALIVYQSFSKSFEANIFSGLKWWHFALLLLVVATLFFTVYFVSKYLARLLNFNREDTITAKISGSKKSLVHGSVMAKIIFGNGAALGIYLLPIMLYHIFQLVVVAYFAEKLGKQST